MALSDFYQSGVMWGPFQHAPGQGQGNTPQDRGQIYGNPQQSQQGRQTNYSQSTTTNPGAGQLSPRQTQTQPAQQTQTQAASTQTQTPTQTGPQKGSDAWYQANGYVKTAQGWMDPKTIGIGQNQHNVQVWDPQYNRYAWMSAADAITGYDTAARQGGSTGLYVYGQANPVQLATTDAQGNPMAVTQEQALANIRNQANQVPSQGGQAAGQPGTSYRVTNPDGTSSMVDASQIDTRYYYWTGNGYAPYVDSATGQTYQQLAASGRSPYQTQQTQQGQGQGQGQQQTQSPQQGSQQQAGQNWQQSMNAQGNGRYMVMGGGGAARTQSTYDQQPQGTVYYDAYTRQWYGPDNQPIDIFQYYQQHGFPA